MLIAIRKIAGIEEFVDDARQSAGAGSKGCRLAEVFPVFPVGYVTGSFQLKLLIVN